MLYFLRKYDNTPKNKYLLSNFAENFNFINNNTMLRKRITMKICMLVACVFSSLALSAQNDKAQLTTYTMSDGSTFRAMSDNGKWAIAYGPNSNDQDAFPKLINLVTKETINLADGDGVIVSNAGDVTDDGQMVVGAYQGYPATWNTATKEWTKVALPEGCENGRINAVTPDGKYAVGTCGINSNMLYEVPTMWDLTTGKIIATPNIPQKDQSGEYQLMTRFTGISADARYIVGCISFSYPQDVVYFFYDRQEEKFDPVVFDFDDTKKYPYIKKNENVYGLDAICVSPNGKWISGVLYTMNDERSPFRYNTETKEMEYYLDAEDLDKGCVSIDNEGTVYAATPAVSPSRSLYVRHNGYWYGIDEILSQVYGINYYTHTGYDASGLAISVSDDCKSMVSIAYINTENYHLVLPETFGAVCEKVDLLKKFTISPMDGATMAKISSVTLTFSRPVEVLGKNEDIALKDANGNIVKNAIQFEVNANNSKIVNIGFRTFTLEEGKEYTLVIPAGAICLKGDSERSNGEINVKYKGYGSKDLTMTAVSPENGSMMGQFDMTTSPVVFSFDTEVAVPSGAKAYLYKVGEDEPQCELSILAGKTSETYKQVMVYPVSTQLLYKGTNYRVVLPAGAVTDLSGACKNKECSVEYEGVYERTIQGDEDNIIYEDFSGGVNNMLLYDGDQKKPTSDMQEWGFEKNMPWIHAADDDFTNTCAVSHSMYMPSGKSNDWMVCPQITVPDKNTVLKFKGQSYLYSRSNKEMKDMLKVIVYASDEKINELDADVVAKMREDGEVVFNEQLTPGENENTLKDDWTDYSVDLGKYAGKQIYIAFVNENTNQSAIFVTDIAVKRMMDVTIALSGVETSQVGGKSQKVKGTATIANETNTYNKIAVKLIDTEGNVVEEVSKDGVEMKKGDTFDFEFTKEIALATGKKNTFSVQAVLNDGETSYQMEVTITNLLFQTEKRVVLEEMTGQGCQNCPLGHLALEKLESVYGDKLIPLCYHTYTGDNLESGMTSYVQTFLGLNAAPSATIHRYSGAYSPMTSITNQGEVDYVFSASNQVLWLERVGNIMSKDAEADFDITASYDETTDKLTIPVSLRPAVELDNVTVGLFCVITEDNLSGYQQNNLYTTNDDDLGEWQAGGMYGKSVAFPYIFNDVARALYPANNYLGQTGLLPASMKSGETYSATISFGVKENAPYVSDIKNCKATVMAINTTTGEIINVARAKIDDSTGIKGVEMDDINADAPTHIYNIGGRAADKGLVIVKQGNSAKKTVIK